MDIVFEIYMRSHGIEEFSIILGICITHNE